MAVHAGMGFVLSTEMRAPVSRGAMISADRRCCRFWPRAALNRRGAGLPRSPYLRPRSGRAVGAWLSRRMARRHWMVVARKRSFVWTAARIRGSGGGRPDRRPPDRHPGAEGNRAADPPRWHRHHVIPVSPARTGLRGLPRRRGILRQVIDLVLSLYGIEASHPLGSSCAARRASRGSSDTEVDEADGLTGGSRAEWCLTTQDTTSAPWMGSWSSSWHSNDARLALRQLIPAPGFILVAALE